MPIIQPKGLRGLRGFSDLSSREKESFLSAYAGKLKKYEKDPLAYGNAAAVLYRNQLFRDKYGEAIFNKYNDGTKASYDFRNKMYENDIINEEANKWANPYNANGTLNPNKGLGSVEMYNKFMEMDADAKREVLESGFLNPSEFTKKWDIEGKKRLQGNNPVFVSPTTGVGFTGSMMASQIYSDDAKKIATAKNQKIFDDIYNSYVSRVQGNPDVQKAVQNELDNYSSLLSDTQVKKAFINAITRNDKTGNLGISEYASHYGNGTPEDITWEMSDFSIDDMRRVIAEKRAYDKLFSPTMAETILNNDAKRYISDHQNMFKKGWLFGKDVAISIASYTADKANGIYDIGLGVADALYNKPQVYIGDDGSILDPNKTKFSLGNNGVLHYIGKDGEWHSAQKREVPRVALHQMGYNMDGSEDTSMLNPSYWTKAEQYGTLDKEEQDKYAKIGSSPYKLTYAPEEDTSLAYESFKMMSFGIADQALNLLPYGIGRLGNALNTASKLGKAVNTIGKGLEATGRLLSTESKVGGGIQAGLGAIGISEAYARGAYPETLQENLLNLEKRTSLDSWNEINERYTNDKDYQKQVNTLINQKAATLKKDYLIKIRRDGGMKIADMQAVDKYVYNKAKEEVIDTLVSQRIQEKKATPEYADMQEKAIQGATQVAVATFLPEAVKYGIVNNLGYRKFLYTNPAGLTKKVSASLKGLGEITTKEGRKRLALTTSKFLTNTQKKKELLKTIGSQFWGGAWTNGTDDMMVDAAQQINTDSYTKYLDAFSSGEPISNTYGLADGMYSYWSGLLSSAPKESTINAALVGGIGSLVSVGPNFANIASMFTKSGRKAYKDATKLMVKTDKEGNLRTAQQDLGFLDRVNFFITNGVLNSYYAKKQKEADIQKHADYVNRILDDAEDFKALESLVASHIAGQDYTSFGDQKTGEYIKALEQARALQQLANNSKDPATMSSVVQNAKNLITKLSQVDMENGNNPLTEEETENLLAQYYSNNPGIPKTEENSAKALAMMADNARELQSASDAYTEAGKEIYKIEKKNKLTLDPQVRHKLQLEKALTKHWEDRFNSMQSEIGDHSTNSSYTDSEALIASVGGVKNAQQLAKIYEVQQNDLNEEVDQAAKKSVKAKEEYDAAVKKLEEAEKKDNSDEKLLAQKEVEETYKLMDNTQAEESYIRSMLNISKKKEEDIRTALAVRDASVSVDKSQVIEEIQSKIDALNKQRETLIDKEGKIKDGKIKEVQSIDKQIEELEKSKETSASAITLESKDKVLTADEIFALAPTARARMMNKDNRHLYSDAQKQEIENLEKELVSKDADALSKIQDIALLSQRINTSKDAYNRIIQHPDAAAFQFEAQRDASMRNAASLTNLKVAQTQVDFINNLFNAVKSHLSAEEFNTESKKAVFNYLKQLNPILLDTIDKYNMLPTYTDELYNAQEWGETSATFSDIIDTSDKEDGWKETARADLDTIVQNAHNKKEILEQMEKAVNDVEKSDPNKAESLRYMLQKYQDLEHQSEAVKVETKEEKKVREEQAGQRQKVIQEEQNRIDEKVKAAAENQAKEEERKREEKKSQNEEKVKEANTILEALAEEEKKVEIPAKEESKDENTEEAPKEVEETSSTENQKAKEEPKVPTSEISYIDEEGDIVQGKTPTTEEQIKEAGIVRNEILPIEGNEDADSISILGQQIIDNDVSTLSGNAMSEYSPIPLANGILEHKRGATPGDKMNQYYDWMKSTGIKLQNIIDHELSYILVNNPTAKVRFMSVKPERNATNDVAMQNHLMLVLDYDNSINKGITDIHDDANGGVIESNGKKYLIIGTVGYGKRNEGKFALYKMLWDSTLPGGLNLKAKRKQFFDAHPKDRFYVEENLFTEIVPKSLIPGFIIRQSENDSNVEYRSILTLLEDPKRNPYNLELDNLGWGIQTLKSFTVIKASSGDVMPPRESQENSGRAFVLIPASNGKLAPSYLKPLRYTEMNDGTLKKKIDTLLNDVVSPNYETRLEAVKALSRILYLDKNGNDILLRKSRAEVSLVYDGAIVRTFILDNNFDRSAFLKAFEDINPRINVTPTVFNDLNNIREYAEAGALSTDAAILGTAGSSYSIYGLDSNGNILRPNTANNSRVSSSPGITRDRRQIVFRHNFYTLENGKYYLNDKEVTDAKEIKQLDYLKDILDRSLSPVKSKGALNYYILNTGDNPLVITVDRNSKEVKEVSEKEAKTLIKEIEEKRKQELREKGAKEALKTQEPLNVGDIDLNLKEETLGIDSETGDIISPISEEKTKEHTSEENISEVTKEPSSTLLEEPSHIPTASSEEATTQSFQTLIKNKKYKAKIIKLIKGKWEKAPNKIADIEKFLRDRNIEIDTIGTSPTAIEAWIKTIEDCR